MKKILWIDACVRKESRTRKLAEHILSKLGGTVTRVDLDKEQIPPLTGKMLTYRSRKAEEQDFSDPVFRYAVQFKDADEILISAPYWDLSFPAILKIFIENIYVTGLVTKFGENGRPVGLCKAKKLYYVATSGGKFIPDFSYNYIESLCKGCFGIKETELIFAQMLDVDGFDAEKIMADAINEINAKYE